MIRCEMGEQEKKTINLIEESYFICRSNLYAAMKNIRGEVPFKLYLYLMGLEKTKDIHFYPAKFANISGENEKSTSLAYKELVFKGYIKEKSNGLIDIFPEPNF